LRVKSCFFAMIFVLCANGCRAGEDEWKPFWYTASEDLLADANDILKEFDEADYLVFEGLDDVFGQESVKKEAEKIIDMLKNYSCYAEFGAELPQVLTIKGGAGTGKKLLARVIAGQAGAYFVDADSTKNLIEHGDRLERRPVVVFVGECSHSSLRDYLEKVETFLALHKDNWVLVIHTQSLFQD